MRPVPPPRKIRASLQKPRRDIIECAAAAAQPGDAAHLRALKFALELGPDKGRVAHDVAAPFGRQQRRPIGLQRIAMQDMRRILERDAGIVQPERLIDGVVGDMVHHPHGHFGYARRKFLELDPIELIDGDAG